MVMKNLLKSLSSVFKSKKSTVESYGQTDCPLPPQQIQSIMEWLFASLLNAGYVGRSHLIWDLGDQDWKQVALTALLNDEPLFIYRCNDRLSVAPEHCCWRLMTEHPSLRIYQLEVQ
jgi:hypothetical protein